MRYYVVQLCEGLFFVYFLVANPFKGFYVLILRFGGLVSGAPWRSCVTVKILP